MIGGSFALAAREAGLARKITGWDTPEALEKAGSRGVIDAVEESFGSGAECCADLVYLAAPIYAISDFLAAHGKQIRAHTLVTDAGSTKREICRAAREGLRSDVRFVGGHPIAGSHHSGVEYAAADTFRDAPYAIIASVDRTGRFEMTSAVNDLVDILKAIGARPVLVTETEHDYIAARVSHAVQIVSTSLAVAAAKSNDREARARVAGSGFVDMIRLAQSDWAIWEGICRTNADEIATALREVVVEVERLREAIESGDFALIGQAFRLAGDFAARWTDSKTRSDDP